MRKVFGVMGCEGTESPLSASLQLEVLTNLANETNIPTVLREFQVWARAAPIQRGPGELPAAPCAQRELSCGLRLLLRVQSGETVILDPLPMPLLALGQGVSGRWVRVSLLLPESSLWHDESLSEG